MWCGRHDDIIAMGTQLRPRACQPPIKLHSVTHTHAHTQPFTHTHTHTHTQLQGITIPSRMALPDAMVTMENSLGPEALRHSSDCNN